MLLDNLVVGMATVLTTSVRMINQLLAWIFILNYYTKSDVICLLMM